MYSKQNFYLTAYTADGVNSFTDGIFKPFSDDRLFIAAGASEALRSDFIKGVAKIIRKEGFPCETIRQDPRRCFRRDQRMSLRRKRFKKATWQRQRLHRLHCQPRRDLQPDGALRKKRRNILRDVRHRKAPAKMQKVFKRGSFDARRHSAHRRQKSQRRKT